MLLLLIVVLIELVLGFESYVGGTFDFFCEIINQRNQLLGEAPSSVGRRNSMRVDEARKG